MKAIIVYPLAFDRWQDYEKGFWRFCSTFKKNPPGHDDYEVAAVCTWGMPDDDIKRELYGIKHRFVSYFHNGCDIGAAQFVARQADDEALIIGLTSLCYFHRPGWLKRYVEVAEKYPDGLYSASASHEGGKLHACTRGYAMRVSDWQNYNHMISSREDGPRFESGEWSITDWFHNTLCGRPVMQIRWDGEEPIEKAREASHTGIFRRGEQNEMLLWDRHTDLYRDADPEEKKRLEQLADGA